MPIYRGGTIINIAGLTPVDDPEYRYKMPAVFGKIEGSGNGIKTAIPNITDVATSLHRSPGEVNKFFGTELGAQTRYNAETDRAIVNGAHTDAVLQELVHRYVEKFVLCPNCGLPETDYKIKGGAIFHKCAACGAKEMVDMSHKLCNYILAEAKKGKDASKKDSSSSSKKEKEDKKKSKKKDSKEGSDDDKNKKKDKKDKKSSSKKKEKSEGSNGDSGADYIKDALLGKTKNGGDGDDLLNGHGGDFDKDDDDEDDDSSDASVAGVDDAGARVLAIQATKAYLVKNPNPSNADLVEFVTNQQMASALKSQERIYILVHGVLTPQFFKNKEVHKYAPVVSKITNGNRIMERHLIAALESFCVDKPKNFPVLIKQLYDEDALEEETILEWADEGRSEYTLDEVDEETRAVLRGEAEPVVVWLQEADSEDDDEDDSDEHA